MPFLCLNLFIQRATLIFDVDSLYEIVEIIYIYKKTMYIYLIFN